MRFHRLAYAAILGALAAAIACSKGATEHLSDLSGDSDAGDVVLGPDNQPAATGPAGSGLVTRLPCDVQAVVENRCISCHEGTTPGAPRLLDYAGFQQPSKADPTKTLAAMSLIRMKNGQMPPAPAEPPNADEIQIFEDWITGGTQKGGLCTDSPPDGGGGGGDEAGVDAAPGCTSGVMWTMANTGSPNMHPGGACNACHSKLEGPNLTFAGTVYRGQHDIDDCNGTGEPAPITVVITDKNGQTATLVAGDTGNFYLEAPKADGGAREGGGGGGNGNGARRNGFRPPFRAKVVSGATQRQMLGSVTSGDCNSCHTSPGINGAPGRSSLRRPLRMLHASRLG